MQLLHLCVHLRYRHHLLGCGSNRQVIMLRSEGLGVPLGALEGLEVPLGGSRGPGSASGGLWGLVAAKFVVPKIVLYGAI